MPRPVPFLFAVELVVLGAVALLLGLYLILRGTLPRWMPSGFVDQAGNRAELSRPVYRLLGVTSVLAGIACPLVALSQLAPILIALGLIAAALVCAIPAAVMALSEQHRRSLRRKWSTEAWSFLGFIVVMTINGFFLYATRP
jgi:uncharacterized protein YjeT (DUF2065 family)